MHNCSLLSKWSHILSLFPHSCNVAFNVLFEFSLIKRWRTLLYPLKPVLPGDLLWPEYISKCSRSRKLTLRSPSHQQAWASPAIQGQVQASPVNNQSNGGADDCRLTMALIWDQQNHTDVPIQTANPYKTELLSDCCYRSLLGVVS
jgi:hypothetical protein